MIRISFEDLNKLLIDKLLELQFTQTKASTIGRIISESTLDGVNSHGINRFPRFVQSVRDGFVKKDADPAKIGSFGSIEQWDGNSGPGILNASFCMTQAIKLAEASGIACIGLRNTNHWLRGGSYGWQAARAGYIGICFTNTKPNMVPWGGSEPRIGNNPLIIAIPRKEGHVVIDMAMSQYSFGKIEKYANDDKKLPYPGGFDNRGNLSGDPHILLKNEKTVPIGYWKGSALSMVLDMLAALLSSGDPVFKIGERNEEYGLSQVFIAINPQLSDGYREQMLREIIEYNEETIPFNNRDSVYYPGQRTLKTRERNLKNGIPVERELWEKIKQL